MYLARSAAATKDDFRQVALNDLRLLPIFPADDSKQKDIVRLVEFIVKLKEDIRNKNLSDEMENYYATGMVSTESLESFLNWNKMDVPSEKKILVNKSIYGEVEHLNVRQQGEWLTVYCTGKKFKTIFKLTTGEKIEKHAFVNMPLFKIKEEDDKIREFISYHITNEPKIPYSKNKTLLTNVLNIKIPRFALNAKQNISYIIKTVQDYRKGMNDYQALTQRVLYIDSKIDAEIFGLYGISSSIAEGIMTWLDQGSEFMSAVLSKMQ